MFMIDEEFNGIKLKFNTDGDVFSPSSLDTGTKAMLNTAKFNDCMKVLDLGCGYGFAGIYISKKYHMSKVVMCDISEDAIRLGKINLELNNINAEIFKSNGFENIETKDFDVILSNPPYHADFSVPKHFIEEGFKHLKAGGYMYMVTKRLDWYKNKMLSVFGGVKVYETDGYYIFASQKREKKQNKITDKQNNKRSLSKKLAKKYKKR